MTTKECSRLENSEASSDKKWRQGALIAGLFPVSSVPSVRGQSVASSGAPACVGLRPAESGF